MKKDTDFTPYILPVGGLFLLYLVLTRFGLIKTTQAETKETEQLFKNYFSPLYLPELMKRGGRIQVFTQRDAENVAKSIYNAKGVFNDDETALYSAIKKFKYKSQISQTADKFSKIYNKDLAYYLSTFLNSQELDRIYQYTDSLPSGKI